MDNQIHPETFCQRCGRPNLLSWYTDNALWNEIVRARQHPEILCPVCFGELARECGYLSWRVCLPDDGDEIDRVHTQLHHEIEARARLCQENARLRGLVEDGITIMGTIRALYDDTEERRLDWLTRARAESGGNNG